MSWTPLELLSPPREQEQDGLRKNINKPQTIGALFENSPIVEVIDFGEFFFADTNIKTEVVEEKPQWKNIHIRHKIRIYISLVLLLGLIIDLILNLLGLPSIWSFFSDILSIVGAFGLFGTAVYLAIDSID